MVILVKKFLCNFLGTLILHTKFALVSIQNDVAFKITIELKSNNDLLQI
jgi:hypothetical protein